LPTNRSLAFFANAEAGISAHKHAISDATFYTWRKKYGGMEVPEVKRLKSPEEETGQTQEAAC
jgi:putative transposase